MTGTHIRRVLRGARRFLPRGIRSSLSKRLYYDPAIRSRGYRLEDPALFEAVFFEVVTRCNSRCSFCAASVGNDRRAHQEMPFELYAKVVAELGELGFTGRVAYHVANEPLLFKPLESFVRHAKEALPRCHVQIMTNGLALTPARGERLLDAGVDEIVMTFYRRRRGEPLYRHVVDFRDRILRPRFPVRRGARYSSRDGGRAVVFKVLPRYLDEVLWSRGGTAPNKTASPDDVSGFCRFPWTQFNVTTDGRVSKCCADALFEDPMGNVRDASVAGIWRGERFGHVRRELWQGRRERLPSCRGCDYFGLSNQDITNPLLLGLKQALLAGH
jgi:radical SAM protein with 4Fe4S-binding SPASM domain